MGVETRQKLLLASTLQRDYSLGDFELAKYICIFQSRYIYLHTSHLNMTFYFKAGGGSLVNISLEKYLPFAYRPKVFEGKRVGYSICAVNCSIHPQNIYEIVFEVDAFPLIKAQSGDSYAHNFRTCYLLPLLVYLQINSFYLQVTVNFAALSSRVYSQK